jgi:hypothetical protein
VLKFEVVALDLGVLELAESLEVDGIKATLAETLAKARCQDLSIQLWLPLSIMALPSCSSA